MVKYDNKHNSISSGVGGGKRRRLREEQKRGGNIYIYIVKPHEYLPRAKWSEPFKDESARKIKTQFNLS